jgi:hypothetical protein
MSHPSAPLSSDDTKSGPVADLLAEGYRVAVQRSRDGRFVHGIIGPSGRVVFSGKVRYGNPERASKTGRRKLGKLHEEGKLK